MRERECGGFGAQKTTTNKYTFNLREELKKIFGLNEFFENRKSTRRNEKNSHSNLMESFLQYIIQSRELVKYGIIPAKGYFCKG